MAELRVLLDSCVMFPMYLRDTLLCTAEAGLYLPYWSQEILNGATRNLVSTGRMPDERAVNLEARIKEAFPDAMVEIPVGLAEVMTNHSGDRHVLAAAVASRADVIVTTNLKHFKAKDLAPWRIEAQSPDFFLTYLYDLYPNDMVQVVRRQSQTLKRPPMTIIELLALLSEKGEVPQFAGKIRAHECGNEVVQTANKALSMFGKVASEGGRCFEGEQYRLWRQGATVTITAKDNRGEILRSQNGQIVGHLSSEDVSAFKNYEQHLEQALAEGEVQRQKLDDSPLDAE